MEQSAHAAAHDPWQLLLLGSSSSAPFPATVQQQQQQLAALSSAHHPPEPRTAAGAHRLYRRIAALVHPDKCMDPAWAAVAHAAFKAVAAARDAAVKALPRSAGGGGGGSSSGGWKDGEEEEGDDEDGAFAGDDEAADDDDDAWWGEWDDDAARGRCSDGAGASGAADMHTGRRPAAPNAAFPNTEPTPQDVESEAPALYALPLEDLKKEVTARQAAVLAPRTEDERAAGPEARQRRLRVARDVLSARLEEVQRAREEEGEEEGGWCGGGGGGFVADGGGEWVREAAGGFSGEEPHKRQRVEETFDFGPRV
jgi:hypothetical protein